MQITKLQTGLYNTQNNIICNCDKNF